MIVTAHQPNYLPGVSVLAKVAAADVVIWLDELRFTSPGWVNRNQLPDGTWLAVPVERRDHRTPIKDVTIASDVWQREHVQTLVDRYSDAEHFDAALVEIIASARAGDALTELTGPLLTRLLQLAGVTTRETWQSALRLGGQSISERMARIVARHGGTTFLAGPGQSRVLDVETFESHGVELSFHHFEGDNPSAVDPLMRVGVLPTERASGVRSEIRAR